MARPSAIRISDLFLVTEASSSELGVRYEREVLSEKRVGEREERLYQTRRVIENRAEAQRARAVYEQARARLRNVCTRTVLGLVCPTAREAELRAAIDDIEAMVAAANRELTLCRVDYTVVPIRIEHENSRAQDALERELRQYLERLLAASEAYDPEELRRILRSGKGLESLVEDPTLRAGLEEISGSARRTARAMTRRIKEHAGDVAAARASAPADESVARRFPWASAFDVTPATVEGAA